MPCWYFDKYALKNTPSSKDSIDYEKESRYRREGSRFIMDLGTSMGLRKDTMATGIVFFHRFYMIHSFNEFPRYVMATCCLFLAGKVEETPKKCKDLVRSAKTYLESKKIEKYWPNIEDPIKEIMTYERILLQSIKFDLQVDHPYNYLLKYAKTLKGDQESIRKMVQMAWTFINDSYCTTLCLQWEPEIIAIALMYLTSKLSKFEITDWISKKENSKQKWWEQFVEGLNVEILEDICHQVLDLYAQQQQQSPGQQSQLTPLINEHKANIQNSQNHVNSNKRKSPSREQLIQENIKHFKSNEQPYRQNSNNILIINDQQQQQQQPQHHITSPSPFQPSLNSYTQSMMQQSYNMYSPYPPPPPPPPPQTSSASKMNKPYQMHAPPPPPPPIPQTQQFQMQKPIVSAYDQFILTNNNNLIQTNINDQQRQSQGSRNSALRMVDIAGRKN